MFCKDKIFKLKTKNYNCTRLDICHCCHKQKRDNKNQGLINIFERISTTIK